MASAGPKHTSPGPKQEKSVWVESGTLPAGRAELHLPWQQAKPIWNLEWTHVSAFHSLLPSGIPLQQSCFLCSPSLCHTCPSEDALLSPSSAQPCLDPGRSTLFYQRSCLRPKPYGLPFESSPDTGSTTGRVMSSLLTEPCLQPALAEECSETGLKGPALSSGQQSSSFYRPVLNNNSFLWPSSAKVPFPQSLEIKKVKNTHSIPTTSWSHSRHGDRSPSSLVNRAVKSSNHALEQTAVPSVTVVPGSATLRKDQCLRQDTERTHSLKEKEPEMRISEAVQQLARQTATHNGIAHRTPSSALMNIGSLSNWNSRCRQNIIAQLTPKEAIAPRNLELGSSCLNSNSSLAGTDAVAGCTKRIGVCPFALHAASPERGADCQCVSTPSSSRADRMVCLCLFLAPLGPPSYWPGISACTSAPRRAVISLPCPRYLMLPGGLLGLLGVENICHSWCDVLCPSVPAEQSPLELSHPQDEAEEELPDGLDESSSQEEDEDSKCWFPGEPNAYCFISPRKCIECLAQPAEAQEKVLKPALVSSLFPNVPPTLYFSTRDEAVEKLPWEQRKLLRWKMCTITPNIVKQTISRSHFRVSKSNNDWLGYWGHHMKSPSFRTIKEHQKPASARGIGIQVIHKWSQLPKRRPLLVQRYLHKPYLIGGKKFDLRIYVYVTCYDPLRVYLFKDGLVRFASCKYSSSIKSLSNKFVHLTNYSVNKKNTEYKSNSDETACQGHKWALKALWSYLNQKGVNSEAIWEKIKDIVIKTIIASEPYVNSLVKMYVRRPYCCHELFGFDIMLDENLKPWILEVNISPSLHTNSPLDVSIKGQMIRDLLNLAGFVLPSADSVASRPQTRSGSTSSMGSALKEKPKPMSEHFIAEKMKKAYYLMQKIPDQDFYSSVLDVLTSDDVRILVETEDEYSRCGQFERVFPTHISMRYLRFFEQPRYFNILVTQWELKYYLNKHKGNCI
uniref:Tubulin polyglutamylase TTLL4 n=1 Tax=Amazona collaria TaxID=241587 RepID=A0A8B9G929_9PSIT